MWWGWYDYAPAPWMHFAPLFVLAMMAVCALMMFFMMRGHRSEHSGDSAAEILRERFARGGIDKAEYEERRRVLEV